MNLFASLFKSEFALWHRVAGATDGPPVLYLHGGPGHNCFAFEKIAGPFLEPQLRMIYMDQRGCGRSGSAPLLNITETLRDIEALRTKLKLKTLNLLGHSFGGILALDYLRAFPQRVNKIVLIEIAKDLQAVLQQQLEFALNMATRHSKASERRGRKIIESEINPRAKLGALAEIVGDQDLHRAMLWHNQEAYTLHRRFDMEVPRSTIWLSEDDFRRTGASLGGKICRPALLIAGRRGQGIGHEQMVRDAREWEIPIHWCEQSAHFPYAEQPEEFADAVTRFFCA